METIEKILPEFINFWIDSGTNKFIRVFWYFLIFEFTRYIILDYYVYFFRWFNKSSREEKWRRAREKLYKENPLISIVVPGKNEGKHLYKLVKSLNEQTYQNFELIIVDDGSDDQLHFIEKNAELVLVIKDEFEAPLVYKGKGKFLFEQLYATNMTFEFSEDGQTVIQKQGNFTGHFTRIKTDI